MLPIPSILPPRTKTQLPSWLRWICIAPLQPLQHACPHLQPWTVPPLPLRPPRRAFLLDGMSGPRPPRRIKRQTCTMHTTIGRWSWVVTRCPTTCNFARGLTWARFHRWRRRGRLRVVLLAFHPAVSSPFLSSCRDLRRPAASRLLLSPHVRTPAVPRLWRVFRPPWAHAPACLSASSSQSCWSRSLRRIGRLLAAAVRPWRS
mmetsp:Transcript_9882/g.60228  ORF Transcript_9882/g.60228 Transcript_9882/m.60228 type:complete len:203 (+) Transcript_9882:1851-2459(+)